ncbi:MAG: universal stress protein [Nitrospinae bacterium]|nr:universal stress protein [Nitrospinota bacterium]
MYKDILTLLDNSDYSLWGLDRAIEIANQFGSTVYGTHSYAARLHEERFIQMEPGLPARYQEPDEMMRQRQIHGELIEKGLGIISDSYLDVFQERCDEKGVPNKRRVMEGKNYSSLVKEIETNSYELVTLGIRGQGEVKSSQVGSVCERVTRRVNTDVLIAKNNLPLKGGHIVVGIDGSPQSYAAMQTAIDFSKRFDCKVTALAVFDPEFHYRVFNNITKVLSEEAGKVFRFKEQEKLHEEIIDSGLEKIYRDHLNCAMEMATREGLTNGNSVKSEVLPGKPFDAILNWLTGKDIALLLLGKVGVHCDDGLDIGSNSEFLFRNAPCNVLLVSRKAKPEPVEEKRAEVEWTAEALEMLNRVPGFVRNLVRGHMETNAHKDGKTKITLEMMLEARKKMGM